MKVDCHSLSDMGPQLLATPILYPYIKHDLSTLYHYIFYYDLLVLVLVWVQVLVLVKVVVKVKDSIMIKNHDHYAITSMIQSTIE